MTDRRLTDAQIATALRAHLPTHAQPGLRGRAFEQIEATPQRRPLPSFLGALTDADPIGRRRSVLLAAAMLVALALATAVGVGALLQSRQPDQRPLSLDPPENVDAYVTEAYPGLLDLPALSLTVIETEGTKGRWSYDGHGHVRLDHYFSPTDPEPGLYQVFGDDTMSEIATTNGEQAWVEHSGQGSPLGALAGAVGLAVDCPTPWTYVGLEYLIGRPTHHVACGDSAMWLDIETGLSLKSIRAQPVEIGPTIEKEVLELAIAPQPASLFEPPAGMATIGDEAFDCAQDPACASPEPETPQPTTRLVVTPPPAPGDLTPPSDIDALVADIAAGYPALPPLVMEVSSAQGSDDMLKKYSYDSAGRVRIEWVNDPPANSLIDIVTDEHSWESAGKAADGREVWTDFGPESHGYVYDLGIAQRCVPGWEQRGFDLIGDRPALHITCGDREHWVDLERRVVLRTQFKPDPLMDEVWVDEVVDLQFGEPAPGIFEIPDDAIRCTGSRATNCVDAAGEPWDRSRDGSSPSPAP